MPLVFMEIQQWLQPARWEGTLHGSQHQGPAKAAQFQHGEKSSVCRDGLAPLGSTAPLATVTLQPAIAPSPLPLNPPNTSHATLLHPAEPALLGQAPTETPHPSLPSPGLYAHG